MSDVLIHCTLYCGFDLQIAACSFIIVVGVCCACVGTYSSLSKIIHNYT